MIIPFNLI